MSLIQFPRKAIHLILEFAVVVAAFSGSANVQAVTIQFTHEGIGSGHVGGTNFAASHFVITSFADTANRQPLPGGPGFFIDHSSSSIFIEGLGDFTFLAPSRTFVHNGNQSVGFSRSGPVGLDLFNGPVNSAFSNWDMLSSIGPISGTATLLQWDMFYPMTTTGGVLSFTGGPITGTFTATIIPGPTCTALFAAGAWLLRRRSRNG